MQQDVLHHGDLEQMREEYMKLFGSTSKPSQIACAHRAYCAYILGLVTNKVLADDVKMLTDDVQVKLSPARAVAIDAVIHCHPSISMDMPQLKQQLTYQLQQAFKRQALLGWDVAPSWIHAQLYHPDVHHVELKSPQKVRYVAAHDAELSAVTLSMTRRGNMMPTDAPKLICMQSILAFYPVQAQGLRKI